MPSGDVLVLIDESGRVIEWGRPAEELFGWSAEEAVGQSVTALMREVAADGERRGKASRIRPRCWSSQYFEVLPCCGRCSQRGTPCRDRTWRS